MLSWETFLQHRERLVKGVAGLPLAQMSQWIAGGLVLLSCQQLAVLTWHLLPAAKISPQANLSIMTPVKGSSNNALDLNGLLNLKLFGQPDAPTAGKTQAVSNEVAGAVRMDAPKTKLNLTLTGIIASTDPARSLAIIISGGDESGYAIGETIAATRAKVRAVLPDRIILNNQGQDETLMLDGEDLTSQPATLSASTAKAGPDLQQLRQDIAKNPGKILDYLVISPVSVDNKLQGYRINPGKDPNFFQRIGLRPNDLAVSINGNDLRDSHQAMQVMQQLSTLTELNLTVERNGQRQDIYVKLTD